MRKFTLIWGRYLFIAGMFLLSCKKQDSTPPVITLNGESPIFISLNGTFSDPGATATDNEDGSISVGVTGTVNTNMEGTYSIKYQASDAAGNYSEAERTVYVRNDARYCTGDYYANSITLSDTIDYHAVISTSTTINHRIWIQGFGNDSSVVIFGDIEHDSINIPKQQGTQMGNSHYFRGSGIIIITDSINISIAYSDSLSGNTLYGTTKYTRP
jgi:hypothetical protein